jgi:trimethylamine--corrinoid protein Co-methyltransferase
MSDNERLQLKVLTKEDIACIHGGALQTLAEVGLRVEDAHSRNLLSRAGGRIDDEGYVHLSEDLVMEAVSSSPDRITLFNRNGQIAVETRGEKGYYAPGLNCVDVLDHRTGKQRPCLLADIAEVARVCDRLPNIHAAGSLGNPSDVPPQEQAMETVRAIVENTFKPFPFIAHDEVEAERIWSYLADVANGWDALRSKPFAIDLTGPSSPLFIGAEACRRLHFAARNSLPVVCYPALMPGATGPVTLAGALSQSAAEILGGIVIHQLERPGAPVLTGSAIIPFDMHAVKPAYGTPEYQLACIAAAEYFHELGLPTWVGAGCSDAHTVDAQAASEAGQNMLTAALSGTTFIHNLGYLAAGKTGSLEMLVLCDELVGMTERVVGGIKVDDDTLALEITRKASKNERFLTEGRHTLRHIDAEYWSPGIFQRSALDRWRRNGSKTLAVLIREKLREILGE